MNDDCDEKRRGGVLADLLAVARCHLRELATAYLLLVCQMAREEAKKAGRRTVCTAALLALLCLGVTFLVYGISRLVDTWVEFEGGGYLITGGASALLSAMALFALLRKAGS